MIVEIGNDLWQSLRELLVCWAIVLVHMRCGVTTVKGGRGQQRPSCRQSKKRKEYACFGVYFSLFFPFST